MDFQWWVFMKLTEAKNNIVSRWRNERPLSDERALAIVDAELKEFPKSATEFRTWLTKHIEHARSLYG